MLYRGNRWVIISETCLKFPPDMDPCEIQPVVLTPPLVGIQRMTNPVLKVEVNRMNHGPRRFKRRFHAVPFQERVFRGLCSAVWRIAWTFDIHVTTTFSLDSYAPKVQLEIAEMLFEHLSLVRGVQKATVKGISSTTEIESLRTLMETPITTYRELVELLTVYKTQGDVCLRARRYQSAHRSYTYGESFERTVRAMALAKNILPVNEIWEIRFCALLSDMYINTALIYVKMETFYLAYEAATLALGFPGILDKARAKAHYRRGLARVSSGMDEEAAKDFFYAQDIFPQDPAIKVQLRAMEQRLGFKITEDFAPIQQVILPHGSVRVWRGDPRLINGPGGWGMEALFNLDLWRSR